MIRLLRSLGSLVPNALVGDSNSSKQQALIRLLAIAHAQGIAPAMLIDNLASEYPDNYGKKLQLLRRWILANSSMGAALAHTPGVLSENDTLAIQCGIETGTVDETLRFLIEHPDHCDDSQTNSILAGASGYFIGVSIIAVLVSTFLMVFIVPTFKMMFEEFGMRLPYEMSVLVTFCNTYGPLIPFVFFFLLGFAFLLLFEDVRRSLYRSFFAKFLPVARTHKRAGLLRVLAMPGQIGQPIGDTLTAAAQFHSDRRWRAKLLRARTGATENREIFRQLADQGLISKSQGENFGSIESPSVRSWALLKVAQQSNRSVNRHTETFARIGQHLPTVLMGLFVGWVVLAVMHTLTALISSLA